MAKKLFVAGIPWSTQVDSLKEAFAQAGTVTDAVIITNPATGLSKGFGFVTMSSDEEANKAIEMWNGKDFEGRTLLVNEARPDTRPPRTGGERNSGRRDDRGGFRERRSF